MVKKSLIRKYYVLLFIFKSIAADEERKVRIIEENVSGQAKLCEEDLRKAEPALLAAQSALDTLDKTNLTELKSFGSPPEAVVTVCEAVIILFSPKGKIPKDRSWKAAKVICVIYLYIATNL